MKLLIVRSYGSIMNISSYNTQEIGLAGAFIKKGIETDIVLYGGNQATHIQEWKFDDGKSTRIYWLKGISIAKHGIMPEVFEIANSYDSIWINEYDQYTSHKLASIFSGRVYIYHGPYPQDYSLIRRIRAKIFEMIFFDRKVAKNVQVFAKSKLAEKHLKEIGFKNVITVGVGLDLSRFNSTKDINLSNYGIDSEDEIISYIGTIDERRNTLFLLKTFKKIHNKRHKSKLLIIGKPDKKYWKKCINYIEEQKLTKCVVHIEKIEQAKLPCIYKRSSLFMFPSKYDIFGMVLMEAMLFGVPVISSRNGGAVTLISSGKNGYICDFSEDEWSETSVNILRDSDLAREISNEAVKTITQGYTWDSIVNHIIPYMKGI